MWWHPTRQLIVSSLRMLTLSVRHLIPSILLVATYGSFQQWKLDPQFLPLLLVATPISAMRGNYPVIKIVETTQKSTILLSYHSSTYSSASTFYSSSYVWKQKQWPWSIANSAANISCPDDTPEVAVWCHSHLHALLQLLSIARHNGHTTRARILASNSKELL